MVRACALALSLSFGLTAFGEAAFADKGHGLFERSDKDGDGFVTKAEFAAGRDMMFAKLDANGDGMIEQSEIDQARAAWRQRKGKPDEANNTAPQPEARKHRGLMKRMDTDGDGKIVVAEFVAAGERLFAKLDDNSDGKLAKEEMPRHHKRPAADPTPGSAPAQ